MDMSYSRKQKMKNKYPLVKYCFVCKQHNKKVEAQLCAIAPRKGIPFIRNEETIPRGYCLECAEAQDNAVDDMLNGLLKALTEVREAQIVFHKQVCLENNLEYDA